MISNCAMLDCMLPRSLLWMLSVRESTVHNRYNTHYPNFGTWSERMPTFHRMPMPIRGILLGI